VTDKLRDGWPTEDFCPECDVVRNGSNYCSDCGTEIEERETVPRNLPYSGSTGTTENDVDMKYHVHELGFCPHDEYRDVIPENLWGWLDVEFNWTITEDFDIEIKDVTVNTPTERFRWSSWKGVEELPERLEGDSS